MKALSIILLTSLCLGGYSQDTTKNKNATFLSIGGISYGIAINYERCFKLSKKKPIYLSGFFGVGTSFNSTTIPSYIKLVYGKKNQVSTFLGMTTLINWNPTLTSKEDIHDYKTNPNSEFLTNVKTTLPYENFFNIGMSYRKTLKSKWFLQGMVGLAFTRTQSYKKDYTWIYQYSSPNFNLGVGKTF